MSYTHSRGVEREARRIEAGLELLNSDGDANRSKVSRKTWNGFYLQPDNCVDFDDLNSSMRLLRKLSKEGFHKSSDQNAAVFDSLINDFESTYQVSLGCIGNRHKGKQELVLVRESEAVYQCRSCGSYYRKLATEEDKFDWRDSLNFSSLSSAVQH